MLDIWNLLQVAKYLGKDPDALEFGPRGGFWYDWGRTMMLAEQKLAGPVKEA